MNSLTAALQKKKLLMLSSSLLVAELCDSSDEDDDEPKAKRSCWIDEINLTRPKEGMYAKLQGEMRRIPHKFKNYVRMDCECFDFLEQRIAPLIQRVGANFRSPISPGERLAVTLRYLASGSSMTSLSYAFRIGKSTVSSIIPESCDAIFKVLKDEYLKVSIKFQLIQIYFNF